MLNEVKRGFTVSNAGQSKFEMGIEIIHAINLPKIENKFEKKRYRKNWINLFIRLCKRLRFVFQVSCFGLHNIPHER